jgi:catechol 2,3-dioxygenase-like lactoylglutathione lyase family enzyme
MINGAHVVVYSVDPDADRVFFDTILGFEFVDAGHGWLIFALPAAESAFHQQKKTTAMSFT